MPTGVFGPMASSSCRRRRPRPNREPTPPAPAALAPPAPVITIGPCPAAPPLVLAVGPPWPAVAVAADAGSSAVARGLVRFTSAARPAARRRLRDMIPSDFPWAILLVMSRVVGDGRAGVVSPPTRFRRGATARPTSELEGQAQDPAGPRRARCRRSCSASSGEAPLVSAKRGRVTDAAASARASRWIPCPRRNRRRSAAPAVYQGAVTANASSPPAEVAVQRGAAPQRAARERDAVARERDRRRARVQPPTPENHARRRPAWRHRRWAASRRGAATREAAPRRVEAQGGAPAEARQRTPRDARLDGDRPRQSAEAARARA